MAAHSKHAALLEPYIGRTFHLSEDRTFAREEVSGGFLLRSVDAGIAIFEDEGTNVVVPLERLVIRARR